MRLSYGSARYLNLVKSGPKIEMKTLYFMFGERCRFNCAYCAQAKGSISSTNRLSRVIWPKFSSGEIVKAVEKYHEKIKRICFQVVSSEEGENEAFDVIRELRVLSIPVSVSIRIFSVKSAEKWFGQGIERLSVATDAVTRSSYELYRGGKLETHLNLLRELSKRFSGRITTHAIVGLGESEREMVEFLQKMHDWKITVGLFAFTPLRGTKLENLERPSMEKYRRIQVAHYLLRNNLSRVESFSFSEKGEIVDYGIKIDEVSPEAFITSGCPDCTRPFYNEEPGKEPYNFYNVKRVERAAFKVGRREI